MKCAMSLLLLLIVWPTRGIADDRYFPDGSLGRRPDMHEFSHKWYASHLRALEEPSLMKLVEQGKAKGRTVYRFTWLRSFHRPICVRIVHDGDAIQLQVKQLDGKGGYEPGKLVVDKSVDIAEEQYNTFLKLLEKADYVHMPPRVDYEGRPWYWDPTDKVWFRAYGSGTDGAQWILEYCADDKYFFVDRYSPSGSNYGKACLYLIELSGLEVDEIY